MNNQLDIFRDIEVKEQIRDITKEVNEPYFNGMGEPLPWEDPEYIKNLFKTYEVF